ncbi:MAG: hypothetical protein JO327_05715 [Nitrososphaeraceae archaeon]|nr:hypothetical protein [Nitrososphaeraceae archaeon]MBV9667611.1 hypothetical protein [Nitrososphaeraceae archaeon]
MIKKVLSGDEIKQILYSVIEYEIGRKKIQTGVTSDIELSRKYIELIMSKCIAKLDFESNHDNEDQFYATIVTTLSEALLHFMLTICTIPSERKIAIKNDLSLDVIVPSLQSLKVKPERSIIVQFIKEKMDLNKVPQVESLQPHHKNIWLISAEPLSLTTKHIKYYIMPNAEPHNKFSNIIIDIDNFLRETGDKSFRLVH